MSHIYKVNVPVTEILAQKLPISIQMGVLAMLLSLVLGIPLGLVIGRCKNRWPDKLGTALIVLIQAVPAAVYFLYIQMYGTSVLGVGLLFDAANWRYWVLPVCSMSLANLAFYAMWLRRYMVDESNKDYVKLARAKGVSESNIALHHVFRNAMVPLVQYIPSAFLNTVVGSIYIESLYSIPGKRCLGKLCVVHLRKNLADHGGFPCPAQAVENEHLVLRLAVDKVVQLPEALAPAIATDRCRKGTQRLAGADIGSKRRRVRRFRLGQLLFQRLQLLLQRLPPLDLDAEILQFVSRNILLSPLFVLRPTMVKVLLTIDGFLRNGTGR